MSWPSAPKARTPARSDVPTAYCRSCGDRRVLVIESREVVSGIRGKRFVLHGHCRVCNQRIARFGKGRPA